MNRVDVNAEGVGDPAWVPRLEAFALKALDALEIDAWDLSILLCDDGTIRDLNARYRNRDESTDVLSFESGGVCRDPELGDRFIAGDIVVSMDTLAKNAEYFGVDRDEEFRRLVIHGILHLSGLDHADNSPEQPMLARQEAILKILMEEHIFS